MAMMLMPFPCPVVTVTDAHGTDTHAVDTDAMSGILDAHAADAMNQMPMEPIPMPCVVFSGGVRLVIIAIYCTVDHAGTIHLCSQY